MLYPRPGMVTPTKAGNVAVEARMTASNAAGGKFAGLLRDTAIAFPNSAEAPFFSSASLAIPAL